MELFGEGLGREIGDVFLIEVMDQFRGLLENRSELFLTFGGQAIQPCLRTVLPPLESTMEEALVGHLLEGLVQVAQLNALALGGESVPNFVPVHLAPTDEADDAPLQLPLLDARLYAKGPYIPFVLEGYLAWVSSAL